MRICPSIGRNSAILVGLGGLPKKVVDVIKKVGGKLNAIIDLLLLKVVGVIKSMFGGKKGGGKGSASTKGGGKKKPGGTKKSYKPKKKGGGKKKGAKKPKGGKPKKPIRVRFSWIGETERFKNEDEESHSLKLFEGGKGKPILKMASEEYNNVIVNIDNALSAARKKNAPGELKNDVAALKKAKSLAKSSINFIERKTKKILAAKTQKIADKINRDMEGEVRKKLDAIGKALSSTSIGGMLEVPPSNLEFTPINGQGGLALGNPISFRQGNTKGSEPKAGTIARSWEYVKELPNFKSNWVRAHLINHNLHRPGTDQNLTPATQRVNLQQMLEQFETFAKDDVLKEKKVIWLRTEVNYAHSGGPERPEFSRFSSAFADFPSKITMAYGDSKFKEGQWHIGKLIIPANLYHPFRCKLYHLG